MAVISAARVIDGRHDLGPGRVTVDAGRIAALEPLTGGADHAILCPGFVDLQVNGYGADTAATPDPTELDRLGAQLLQAGVTAWLGTITTRPLDDYPPVLAAIHAAAERSESTLLGAHLEGPFLGSVPGAHDPAGILPPDLAAIDRLPPSVRLVTLGAEHEAAPAAARLLRSRGVVVALGHTAPTSGQIQAMVDAGATMVTHLFNAMPPFHHRSPGLAGHALGDDRLCVGLIGDGVHVDPVVVRVAFRAKGRGRVVLVSDSVAAAPPPSDGAVRTPDGTLAGSSITLADAVRNVVTDAGIDLVAAVEAATATPAALLGAAERGSVSVGARADLVALDDDLAVELVWQGGVPTPGVAPKR